MAKKWKGAEKLAEECNELCVELMKLLVFPSGNHPGRKRNLVLTTEEEIADVEAAIEYLKAKHHLDRARIDKRKASKIKKFCKWWGNPYKKAKKASKAKKRIVNASSHVATAKIAPKVPPARPKTS